MSATAIAAAVGFGVLALAIIMRTRTGAGSGGSDRNPSPAHLRDLTVIPPTEGRSYGYSSAPVDPAREQANQAIAQNNEQSISTIDPVSANSGQPIPTIPVSYLTTQDNPVIAGQQQAVFQRTDGKGVPAAAAFKLPSGVAFIEQVPYGAASGAPNVILLSPVPHQHGAPVKTGAPLSEGDAGYSAALASARAKVEATRKATTAAPAPSPIGISVSSLKASTSRGSSRGRGAGR